MEKCYTCSRKLTTTRSVITIEGTHYCSDACRQSHRGQTDEEKRLDKRKDRRRALWKGLPLILLGSLLLLVPLYMVLLLLFNGAARVIDLLGVIYFIPGAAILAVGIYNYKQHAPRSSRR